MSTRSPTGPLLLTAFVALLVLGLYGIFHARLAAGSIYPDYSSLRADANGVKVLFDALTRTRNLTVSRSFKPLTQARAQNATILVLGYSPGLFAAQSDVELRDLEASARGGNRLVVALEPGRFSPVEQPKETSPLEKRWGLKLGEKNETLYFISSSGWALLRANNHGLAIIERAFGSGSIVLAADAQLFTNQQLVSHRETALLSQLIGTASRVIFDEAHLGVQDSGSVLGLARKYRLDGALWGLLLLAAVFIWSGSVGFPPPTPVPSGTSVSGYDVNSGLVHLLRRQIAPTRIVEVCLAEWKRSHPRARLASAAPTNDPLAAYRSIEQAIQQETTRS